MITGIYLLTVSCDAGPECKGPKFNGAKPVAAEFEGYNEREARGKARLKGWQFSRGEARCPACTRATRPKPRNGERGIA